MIGVETDRVTDWSISLTDQILQTVLNRSPALLTLSPTLSRIYHFSATSLVGNVHKSITNFKSTPWNKFEERNQLLSSNDHSCLAPYLYDWNGIPCTPIFLKMVVLDLQDLVMYCQSPVAGQQQQTKKT